MPIYEFRCRSCGKRSSVFVRSIGASLVAVCQHCASPDLTRLFSRVAVLHSDDDAAGAMDEGSLAEVDENDPSSVARWVRKMSRQMGEPLEPEMEADLERLEAGEIPDDSADEPEEDFAGVD